MFFYNHPFTSAVQVSKIEMENEMMGAITQTMKNLLTSVFLKMFFAPNLATPIPSMAPTFSCTNDVGTPLVTEAIKRRLAVTKAMIMASIFPNRIISFPVFCIIFLPKRELPIPKLGATMSVERIIIILKLASVLLISNSFIVIEAIGPAALATLLDPILKAT